MSVNFPNDVNFGVSTMLLGDYQKVYTGTAVTSGAETVTGVSFSVPASSSGNFVWRTIAQSTESTPNYHLDSYFIAYGYNASLYSAGLTQIYLTRSQTTTSTFASGGGDVVLFQGTGCSGKTYNWFFSVWFQYRIN